MNRQSKLLARIRPLATSPLLIAALVVSLVTLSLYALTPPAAGGPDDPPSRDTRAPVDRARLRAIEELLASLKKERPKVLPEATNEKAWVDEERIGDFFQEWSHFSGSTTKKLAEVVLHDNAAGAVHPGSPLYCRALRAGEIMQPPALAGRPELVATVIGTEGATPFTFDGSLDAFETGRQSSVAKISKATPHLAYEFRTGTDLETTLLESGFSAKLWAARLSAGFKDTRSKKRSYAVLGLTQKYYDIVIGTRPQEGYVPAELLAQHPAYLAEMEEHGELGIVRRVTYGRRVIIAIEAECNEEHLHKNLSFSLDLGKHALSAKDVESRRRLWRSMKINAVIVGGSLPASVADVLTGKKELFMENVNRFLKESLRYTTTTSAAPVAFEVQYAQDGVLAASYETAEFAGRDAGRRLRAGGDVLVSADVATGPQHADLRRSDWNPNTDDWTRVNVSYALRVRGDGRAVEAKLCWDLYELERSRKYRGRTHICSTRDWYTIYELPRNDRRSILNLLEGAGGKSTHDFRGCRHGWQGYPAPTGGLRDIQVHLDTRKRERSSVQHLKAKAHFKVRLDRER